MLVFEIFLVGHILAGATGLVSFWVPILSGKGGVMHRRWGRVFTWCMLITGSFAIGMAICTLIAPLETHPKLDDAALVRGVFGWMMLYLAILTINLAWYGLLCIRNRRQHDANREWRNVTLQVVLMIAALNCAWQGFLIDQVLMMGISIVGVAAVLTNVAFMYARRPSRIAWQLEHIKALVGAGISVYTAFFAFGAVRLMPEIALSPLLWSVPLVTGLALIIYHRHEVARRWRLQRQRLDAVNA
jgi:hypothetical protein